MGFCILDYFSEAMLIFYELFYIFLTDGAIFG